MQQSSRERRQTVHPMRQKRFTTKCGVCTVTPFLRAERGGSTRGLEQRALTLSLCPALATQSGRCVHVVRWDENGPCLCGLPPETQTPSLVARKIPENSQLRHTAQNAWAVLLKPVSVIEKRSSGNYDGPEDHGRLDNSLWCVIWLERRDRKRNMGKNQRNEIEYQLLLIAR